MFQIYGRLLLMLWCITVSLRGQQSRKNYPFKQNSRGLVFYQRLKDTSEGTNQIHKFPVEKTEWDTLTMKQSMQSGCFIQSMDNLPNRNSVVSLQIISNKKQALLMWTE